MIELEKLTPFGRKTWAKKKYDEYESKCLTKVIDESVKVYKEPIREDRKEWLRDRREKAKWKTTIDRKVNYLLARQPIVDGIKQEEFEKLMDLIKETATQYILRGSLIWIVQGDGESIEKKPLIMNNTIAVYSDESKETAVAFIRKYTDIEIEASTGAENEIVYYECYYGEDKRDTYRFDRPDGDKIGEVIADSPTFIELGKTGDAPLYAYVEPLLKAYDKILTHQDETTEYNTEPLVEVKGYTGTDDVDLQHAVRNEKIVKTDGNGGVIIHARTMDSTSIELWRKALLQEYYEATCTVGKENELAYAQSGKAMDRLFIDAENSARELANVLESAIKAYYESIEVERVDIIWNTDRPVDDTDIISGIAASQGILSQKTLLEQHPWVDDVDEELTRLASEGTVGMEDLVEPVDLSNNIEEE